MPPAKEARTLNRARRGIRRQAAAWLCGVLGASCGADDPAARIDALRARYTAVLNSFVVRQEPPPAGTPGSEGEGLEGLMAPAPERSDVVLDLVVGHDSREKLAGITLEVGLVDGARQEKERYRIWVPTAGIERGPGAQLSHLLEDVPYEEGDAFFVEVRRGVPPAERSLYREFAGAP